MANLKTWDPVPLRNYCSIDVIVWWNYLKEIRGRFFMNIYIYIYIYIYILMKNLPRISNKHNFLKQRLDFKDFKPNS